VGLVWVARVRGLLVLGRDDSATVVDVDGSREGDRAFSFLCESSSEWVDRRCLFDGRPSMMGGPGREEETQASVGGTGARPISL
jgi:hypothetical protein